VSRRGPNQRRSPVAISTPLPIVIPSSRGGERRQRGGGEESQRPPNRNPRFSARAQLSFRAWGAGNGGSGVVARNLNARQTGTPASQPEPNCHSELAGRGTAAAGWRRGISTPAKQEPPLLSPSPTVIPSSRGGERRQRGGGEESQRPPDRNPRFSARAQLSFRARGAGNGGSGGVARNLNARQLPPSSAPPKLLGFSPQGAHQTVATKRQNPVKV
jgi:hypothetical protein